MALWLVSVVLGGILLIALIAFIVAGTVSMVRLKDSRMQDREEYLADFETAVRVRTLMDVSAYVQRCADDALSISASSQIELDAENTWGLLTDISLRIASGDFGDTPIARHVRMKTDPKTWN